MKNLIRSFSSIVFIFFGLLVLVLGTIIGSELCKNIIPNFVGNDYYVRSQNEMFFFLVLFEIVAICLWNYYYLAGKVMDRIYNICNKEKYNYRLCIVLIFLLIITTYIQMNCYTEINNNGIVERNILAKNIYTWDEVEKYSVQGNYNIVVYVDNKEIDLFTGECILGKNGHLVAKNNKELVEYLDKKMDAMNICKEK